MPEYLIVVGICTDRGCSPQFHASAADPPLRADWPGGYYCLCHGSRYDLAGRVMAGSPAPLNLPVPPHYYQHAHTIVVGEVVEGTKRDWEPSIW